MDVQDWDWRLFGLKKILSCMWFHDTSTSWTFRRNCGEVGILCPLYGSLDFHVLIKLLSNVRLPLCGINSRCSARLGFIQPWTYFVFILTSANIGLQDPRHAISLSDFQTKILLGCNKNPDIEIKGKHFTLWNTERHNVPSSDTKDEHDGAAAIVDCLIPKQAS